MPYSAFHDDCYVLHRPTAADLQRLAAELTQPGLIIFGYEFASLHPLAEFARLEVLKIQGASRLAELEGAEHLQALNEFVLTTSTGSDGSGRCIEVNSLAPLERLVSLDRLVLLGVRPRDLDLSSIMRIHRLREVEISGVPEFTVEHYATLAVALPGTTGRCLKPYIEIPGIGICSKCQGRQVLLNGAAPRARKWICPKCNAKLLAVHVKRWEAVTGKPYQSAP